MPPDRDPAHLHDMLAACRRVTAFIEGIAWESFLTDAKTQSAVVHQLLILGEASKRISAVFRGQHSDIPWAVIARTRDILIHHYDAIDAEEVWRIAARDVPAVLSRLQGIADSLPAGPE